MSKYLKAFDTNTDYSSWENSDEWVIPNVVFIKNNKRVAFNPIPQSSIPEDEKQIKQEI